MVEYVEEDKRIEEERAKERKEQMLQISSMLKDSITESIGVNKVIFKTTPHRIYIAEKTGLIGKKILGWIDCTPGWFLLTFTVETMDDRIQHAVQKVTKKLKDEEEKGEIKSANLKIKLVRINKTEKSYTIKKQQKLMFLIIMGFILSVIIILYLFMVSP